MRYLRRLLTFIGYAILAAQLLLTQNAWAAPTASNFPQLTGHVVDTARVLDAKAQQKIGDFLTAHEQATGDQIVVATIPSLDGENLEEYATALFRHWGLGQKDKNNGVLLLFAMNDHKMRIEVGYGLEGELADAKASLIINNLLTPAFRAENYALGIKQATQKITQILGSEQQYGNLEKVSESTFYGLPEGTTLPKYKRHLVDRLHLLDDKDIEEINRFLLNLEKSTGSRIAIISMPLPKAFNSIPQYTSALYEHWGLGDRDALIILTTESNELLPSITVGTALTRDYEMYYDGDDMITSLKQENVASEYLPYEIKRVIQEMVDRIDRKQNYPHLLKPINTSSSILIFSIASLVFLIIAVSLRKKKGGLWLFTLISFIACLGSLLFFIYADYFAEYPIYAPFQIEGAKGSEQNTFFAIISYIVALIISSAGYALIYAFIKYAPSGDGSSSSSYSSSSSSSGDSSYSGGGGSSGGGGTSGGW